jgi:hypothetical protein
MKLYTEEQMFKIWIAGQKYWETSGKSITFEELLEQLSPIELPSDEEIENDAKKFVLSHNFSLLTNSNHLANRCFKLGAKWMKEQILKNNK